MIMMTDDGRIDLQLHADYNATVEIPSSNLFGSLLWIAYKYAYRIRLGLVLHLIYDVRFELLSTYRYRLWKSFRLH